MYRRRSCPARNRREWPHWAFSITISRDRCVNRRATCCGPGRRADPSPSRTMRPKPLPRGAAEGVEGVAGHAAARSVDPWFAPGTFSKRCESCFRHRQSFGRGSARRTRARSSGSDSEGMLVTASADLQGARRKEQLRACQAVAPHNDADTVRLAEVSGWRSPDLLSRD